jgi:HEPN domain-containing protein
MKPETSRLIEFAKHDLLLAEFAFDGGMQEQCICHCQQAMEKALKALSLERAATGRTRRTHDLVGLAVDLSLNLSEEEFALLRRLGEQYSTSRYGEDVDYEETNTRERLRQSRLLFAWFQQQLS